MILILPPKKPLWMTCKHPEFIRWYKKHFPKAFEREFLFWATPKEYARYQVNKLFEEIRQEGRVER